MNNPHIDSIGNKYWYNERGQNHKTDGPAIELTNGTKIWYENGRRHRTAGPAVEFADGDKLWYIRGTQLTEGEHTLLTFTCYNTL